MAKFFNQDAQQVYRAKASAKTANANTTLSADTELVLPVKRNTTYVVEAQLITDSGTTPDAKIGWSGPTGATMNWMVQPAGDVVGGIVKAIGDSQALDGAGAGTDRMHQLTGLLTVGVNDGTLTLTFAQNTSDASDTKLEAGSWVLLRKVA